MQIKIVITGGLGTGKSTVIDKLIQLKYKCMPEISREITSEAKKKGIDQLFLTKPLLFSQLLLDGREKQYLEADKSDDEIIFFDRGIPDVHGYMNYLGVDYPNNYMEKSKEHVYNYVFMMPPWQEIYTTDNQRYESFKQSLAIYNHLKKTYLALNYTIIEVPIGTVNKRTNFILNKINRMNAKQVLLQKYWKHESFRDPQEKIISAVIDKQNVIALLPTAGGKSVCFQIPAMMSDGVCLVISPLISLMEDQVNSLQQKGIKAIALTSKYNTNEVIQAFDNLRFGNYKFLYLSPEKLQSDFIQEKLSQLKLNLIAIDEAHCISQWGHDFRPSYLKISILKKLFPEVNLIALTASATAEVIKDIKDYLELESVQIFKKSFYRNNIDIKFINTDNVFESLKQMLLKFDEPVIIYVGTRKRTIQISNFLNHNNINSNYYHGGLPVEIKTKVIQDWTSEKNKIIVATNAFGMGIDKPNVRLVIHLNIPNSIENYMQEIGRAGRDGKKSYAYLFYNNNLIFESNSLMFKDLANTVFCKTVYTKLHEYYQISHGELFEKSYSFNLQEFCSKYQLPISKTFSALQCFDNENIIASLQNINKKSRLKILVSNRYLIDYENRNSKLEILLKIILRNYGGAFEQFIAINENDLAKKINTTKSNIIQLLQRLNTDKVIQYNKATNNAEIKFLVPREDRFVINNISKNIENRIRTKINKSKAIIQLVENDTICRNIQLLTYFGETNLKKCNACDICLIEKNKNLKIDYSVIANHVLSLFEEADILEFDEIINRVSYKKNYILKTLELLIDKNTLRLTSQNKLRKVKHG